MTLVKLTSATLCTGRIRLRCELDTNAIGPATSVEVR